MSSSWTLTRGTLSYQEATLATESLESPALGFVKPKEFPGAASSTAAIIKQNNTQIQLLCVIAEQLREIKEDLNDLKKSSRSIQIPDNIDSIISKLEGLSLGTSSPSKESFEKEKGKLYVFKNPYKILKEEQEKLKRKI